MSSPKMHIKGEHIPVPQRMLLCCLNFLSAHCMHAVSKLDVFLGHPVLTEQKGLTASQDPSASALSHRQRLNLQICP